MTVTKLSQIDVYDLDLHQFMYHASTSGVIFGYQPWNSEFDAFDDEDSRLTEIDLTSLSQHPLDFKKGFYLSDDFEASLAWGARFKDSDPVLNYFEITDDFDNLHGLYFNIITDNDLFSWVVAVAEMRSKETERIQNNYQKLAELYPVNYAGYDFVLGPRSDDSVWDFLSRFLSGDLTVDGLKHCIDDLSEGFQLVIKTSEALRAIKFKQYQSYDRGDYSSQSHNYNRNGRMQCVDLINADYYNPYTHPEKQNIDDILGQPRITYDFDPNWVNDYDLDY